MASKASNISDRSSIPVRAKLPTVTCCAAAKVAVEGRVTGWAVGIAATRGIGPAEVVATFVVGTTEDDTGVVGVVTAADTGVTVGSDWLTLTGTTARTTTGEGVGVEGVTEPVMAGSGVTGTTTMGGVTGGGVTGGGVTGGGVTGGGVTGGGVTGGGVTGGAGRMMMLVVTELVQVT